MFTVTVHKRHDMQFVEQIDGLTATEACFLPNDPSLVYRVESDAAFSDVAYNRDALVEALMRHAADIGGGDPIRGAPI